MTSVFPLGPLLCGQFSVLADHQQWSQNWGGRVCQMMFLIKIMSLPHHPAINNEPKIGHPHTSAHTRWLLCKKKWDGNEVWGQVYNCQWIFYFNFYNPVDWTQLIVCFFLFQDSIAYIIHYLVSHFSTYKCVWSLISDHVAIVAFSTFRATIGLHCVVDCQP